MTTQEFIDYYKGLIILQYASLPNALGTVEAYIRTLVQDQIISQVRDAFDPGTAIGIQLNMLGAYRGANREVFGTIALNDWSLVPYGDPAPDSYLGWVLYTDADPTWNWIQYNDLESLPYTLSDSQLRRLLKLRTLVSSSQLSLADLDNILYSIFGVYVNVIDNADMSIVYQHQLADPDPDGLWNIAVISNSLPHPAGVSFTTVEV